MADGYRRDPATAGRLTVGGSLPGTIDGEINDPCSTDHDRFAVRQPPGMTAASSSWGPKRISRSGR